MMYQLLRRVCITSIILVLCVLGLIAGLIYKTEYLGLVFSMDTFDDMAEAAVYGRWPR